MREQKFKTSELLKKLFKTANISRFIKHNRDNMEVVSFDVYLKYLCRERGVLPAHIIKKSGIERTFGHQIFSGVRKPSRDRVIQLAFAFEMNYDETQYLLKIARKSMLYPRIERDAVIIYCLKNALPIHDVQAALFELKHPLLDEVKYSG